MRAVFTSNLSLILSAIFSIDIGVFGIEEEEESELYLKKHKISAINNTVSIIVDKEPIEVGIDPYNKLIDTDSGDNRKRIKSID